MKKTLVISILILSLLTGCEGFLDNPPPTGLSADKLVDIPSMQALIAGAYDLARTFVPQSSLYSTAMVRDILVVNRAEYAQFYDHQLSDNMSSWMYTSAYSVLHNINTVATSDVEKMQGTVAVKNAVLGDMYFLRALVYFDLNNYFELPSTGYSVPLAKVPIGANDRVSCSPAVDIIKSNEDDIEQARTYFKEVSGISNYYAATALAARIYFFNKEYDKAYERANEVIASGKYKIENDVKAPFVPKANSLENIFSFKYNSADGSGNSPTSTTYEAYQLNESSGFYRLNPEGVLSNLMLADTTDKRYIAFYTKQPSYTYINGKYPTDQMNLIYIRLAEMYLTRAEANIMKNNSVSQQDIDDINIIRKRANASTVINSIPDVQTTLEIIFNERTKELAIENGDHYLNVKRLEKGIIKIPSEGTGLKPYSEYSEILVFPFPLNEVTIHNLTRNP